MTPWSIQSNLLIQKGSAIRTDQVAHAFNWHGKEGQSFTPLDNLFRCLLVLMVTKFFLIFSPTILFQFMTVVSHTALL